MTTQNTNSKKAEEDIEEVLKEEIEELPSNKNSRLHKTDEQSTQASLIEEDKRSNDRKQTRIETLRRALLSCIFLLSGISVIVFIFMAFGIYEQSPTLIIATTILGGSITAIIGVIAGTSID